MYLVYRRKSRHPQNGSTNWVNDDIYEEIIEVVEIIDDAETECEYNSEQTVMQVSKPSIEHSVNTYECDVLKSNDVFSMQSTNYFETEKNKLNNECMQHVTCTSIKKGISHNFINSQIVERNDDVEPDYEYDSEKNVMHVSDQIIEHTVDIQETDVSKSNDVFIMQNSKYLV